MGGVRGKHSIGHSTAANKLAGAGLPPGAQQPTAFRCRLLCIGLTLHVRASMPASNQCHCQPSLPPTCRAQAGRAPLNTRPKGRSAPPPQQKRWAQSGCTAQPALVLPQNRENRAQCLPRRPRRRQPWHSQRPRGCCCPAQGELLSCLASMGSGLGAWRRSQVGQLGNAHWAAMGTAGHS